MTLVIPYVRFSTVRQDKGSSRERQLELITSMARHHGWTLEPPLEDLGVSAWKGNHLSVGRLGEFTADVVAGKYPHGTILCVEKIDRLSRQGYDSLNDWMRLMFANGVSIATQDDGAIYRPGDNRSMISMMGRMMKAEAARDYADNISGRVRTAIKVRQAKVASSGIASSKIHPKWLEYDDNGAIQPIPERADIVREIYEMYADGVGMFSIAKTLNERRVQSWSSKIWTIGTIRYLLNNQQVSGDYQPTTSTSDGKKIPSGPPLAIYPRIVDADLVKRVQARIAAREEKGGKPSTADYVNIFQGLSFCAHCFSRAHVQKMEYKGVVTRRFRCSNAAIKGGCEHGGMHRVEPFESNALETMLHLALNDDDFAQRDATGPLANRLAEIEREIATNKTQRDRLLKMILASDEPDDGMISMRAEISETIKGLETQRSAAADKLAKARGQVSPSEHINRVRELRIALQSVDSTVSRGAREKIAFAMKNVVSMILIDDADDSFGEPRRVITMALIGGVQAWKFDGLTGEVLANYDLTDDVRNDEIMRNAMTSNAPSAIGQMTAYLRRAAASR